VKLAWKLPHTFLALVLVEDARVQVPLRLLLAKPLARVRQVYEHRRCRIVHMPPKWHCVERRAHKHRDAACANETDSAPKEYASTLGWIQRQTLLCNWIKNNIQ
jgi:hypothetical protein